MALSNKEVEKQVKACVVNNKEAARTQGVNKLPPKLRKIVFGMMGRDETGKSDYRKSHEIQATQSAAFAKLTKAERTKTFKILRPGIAAELELTWNFFDQLPINSPSTGAPFRCPKNNAHFVRRCTWLAEFIGQTGSYDPTVLTPQWLATWAAHLNTHEYWRTEQMVAPLLAAVISKGGKPGQQLVDILIQSANREHEIGVMGEHIPVTLLMADNRQGWEFVEKLLLAAQRQEGLRQSIFTGMHDVHPGAAKRMFRLMVENRLARFSAVTHFINNHLGYEWDSASVGVINKVLERSAEFMGDPAACKKALSGTDAESAFLALWAMASEDVERVVSPIEQLLQHDNVEFRYVAAKMLTQCPESPKFKKLKAPCYADADIRVALTALPSYDAYYYDWEKKPSGDQASFEALEKLLDKMPKKDAKLKPIVWPWAIETASRERVGAALIAHLGKLPADRLIPHLKSLPPNNRATALAKMVKSKSWSPELRAQIVNSVGDTASYVQLAAFDALKNRKLTEAEIEQIEGYLTRKSNEIRTRVVVLLMKQKEPDQVRSAQRLMDKGNLQQRLGGFEILRQLSESGKQTKLCSELVSQWKENRTKISKEERIQCDAIVETGKPPVTLENGLGFFDPEKLTLGVQPKTKKVKLITPAAFRIIQALDKLLHDNRKQTIVWTDWNDNEMETPLSSASIQFPNPKIPFSKQKDKLALADLWIDWFESRPKNCRDTDGLEIERAATLIGFFGWDWDRVSGFMRVSPDHKKFVKSVLGIDTKPKLKYEYPVRGILKWLQLYFPAKGLVDYQIDCAQTICSIVPKSSIQSLASPKFLKLDRWEREGKDFRESSIVSTFVNDTWNFDKLSNSQIKRVWQIVNWLDKPIPGAPRHRPSYQVTMRAFDQKLATMDDVADQLIGAPSSEYGQFEMLRSLTSRKPNRRDAKLLKNKRIAKLVDEIRARVMDIELHRGEKQTAATEPAGAIETIYGTEQLVAILAGLGKSKFKSGYYYTDVSKAQSLTRLAKHTFPLETESAAEFSKQIKTALSNGLFPKERVLELAFHAPQWINLIEQHLKWKGMCEAMYWFLAHMSYVWGATENVIVGTEYDQDVANKDDDLQHKQAHGWDRLILERTSLSNEQRREGAVDVQWFHRIHSELGAARFDEMAAAARYASSGAQAKRAKYIGDVLTGIADRQELIQKIVDKKLKENVRLLGLMPLAKGRKRDADIKERYGILQDYQKYARGLSSLSKPDALRACEIGLENMARTAGFEDPMRMQWALEAESTKDLRAGYLEASKDDVLMRMDMNEKGMPVTTIQRGGKILKALPTKYRKEPAFVEIRERAKLLKKQAGRIRSSLENAMLRGDLIESRELKQLADHAVLWPMLSRLILIGDGIMGYPDKAGKALRDPTNKLEPIKANEKLRIAHAFDLLKTGKWSAWQRECFNSERIQPFKQLFRELYVVSGQEKKDKFESRRYAGQQIQPAQAAALWSARGWQTNQGVWKSFPDLGINVDVDFEFGWGSPVEVEGLTIETVSFTQRELNKRMNLADVPPIVFSEVMRDMDLVVSVAHRGEVDPEASASTVEMRTTLIEQTCQLLGLRNVKIQKNHALINGQHNDYSLHLGSGQVHVVPGGHVCIVPVHAQHRGRVFLPFADDDPKTAELMSKVLLLARDDEIQDPTILQQLRAASA